MTEPSNPERAAPCSVESPYGWLVVAASMVLMGVCPGGMYLVVVALKPIAADFGWPRSVPSLAYAAIMAGMGIGGILWGRVSDRIGAGPPAAIAVVAVATGAMVVGASDGRLQFLAAHGFMIGFLGNAAIFTPLLANTTRWFDRRRGLAVALVASGQGVAGAVWPPVFRYLVETEGWRGAYGTFAIVALAVGLPTSVILFRRPAVAPGEGGARVVSDADAILGFAPRTVLAILGLAIVGCCVAMAMPIVHVVAHASDLGHPTIRAAEILAVLLGCTFISRIAWGLISDRIGGLSTLYYGCLAQIAALSMYLFFDGLAALYVVSALFGLGFGGIIPSYTIVIRDLFPVRGIGWRIGAVYFFGTIGMALGGYLGGAIFDVSGSYQVAFAVGIAFNVANLALLTILMWRRARPVLQTAVP
ncbi:MAG TPA: MFS transporter [Rhodospirillales bacterium]|jgi:MFS family permease|nr:MFS transporter [Rhodospirillales bacterium]